MNDDGGILLSLRIVLCLGAPLTKRLVNLLLDGLHLGFLLLGLGDSKLELG